MKQNSAKPGTTTTGPASARAGNRGPMQHGHHHPHQQQQHHQMSSFHQQQMQPSAVTFQQQPSSYQQTPQHQQHHHSHLQQQPAGCIVLPSGTYMSQQSDQLPNLGTSIAPMYVGGSPMVQQTSQQARAVGFSTSVQPPRPVGYLQTAQPSMGQQRAPNYQPTVTDFVVGNAVTAGYSGAHQPYKQQQHSQPMQSYQEAPTTSTYPIHMQSSHHPEGSSTEAHYFFDANCTMPVVQQPPPTVPGCRNPKCTSCKSFPPNQLR